MTTAREDVGRILGIPPQTGGDIEEAILLLANRIDGPEAGAARPKGPLADPAVRVDPVTPETKEEWR